jgi:hypothetical protein
MAVAAPIYGSVAERFPHPNRVADLVIGTLATAATGVAVGAVVLGTSTLIIGALGHQRRDRRWHHLVRAVAKRQRPTQEGAAQATSVSRRGTQ